MVPDPAPAISLARMRKLSVGPETGMPLMTAVGLIELLTLSTLLEPEKLMSERPIEAEEAPETLRKRPWRTLRLLPSARLTRLPAILSTEPPATLTRWPLATINALDLKVTIDTASLGMETLARLTRSMALSLVARTVPPLRFRRGAVASTRAVSIL